MTEEELAYFRKIAMETAASGTSVTGNPGSINPDIIKHANGIRYKQPHWKETQSEEDKAAALLKAELKRKRKG